MSKSTAKPATSKANKTAKTPARPTAPKKAAGKPA
ncbi:MAG: hypothetical protein RI972_904, partial [Pseudomonadota bacterium]